MLLHDAIEGYFAGIEAEVARLPAYAESYVEEILTAERANLRIRLRFNNGHLLEINEAIIIESGTLKPLGYRYHCQRADNALIFRYDNTPHFPDLPSFPHHKHLQDKVVAASKPDLLDVLREAGACMG
ncbi:toxin TumE [Ferriphaselus sp. R-1]|uniref:toxin TumE n=1 Tax=Ferriphaselus sp. R-1 TaxID=1485544 RepID=UPI000B0D1577|nr:DUF6516 family protein [Ferriphaselus sp. R-1]